MRIHWINLAKGAPPDERGYWRSAEGRFSISPNYRHTVYPDSYTLSDNLAIARANHYTMNDEERHGLVRKASRSHDTVRDCKEHALNILTTDVKKEVEVLGGVFEDA